MQYTNLKLYAVFTNDFETIESLGKGAELKRQKQLDQHEQEYYSNDKNIIADRAKMQIDTKIERSMLFEISKEDNSSDSTTEHANKTLQLSNDSNDNTAYDTTENANDFLIKLLKFVFFQNWMFILFVANLNCKIKSKN